MNQIKYFLISFIFLGMLHANVIDKITTFEASFTQSIVNSSNKEILYTGTIKVKEPSLMLWNYNSPIEKLVYINQSKVMIVEPDLEQVIVSTLDKEINILELVQDAVKVSKDTYLTTLNDREYTIKIINKILTMIKYQDEIDNNITITFDNIKQNKQIESSVFYYNIPHSFDIIRK